jgi:hypothetical protein
MVSGLTVRLIGITARIEIAESAADARAAIMDAWRSLELPSSVPPDLIVSVAADGDPDTASDAAARVDVAPEESLGERLASKLTLAALEYMSGRALMLHASAVALDDGRVIGFVGPSGRGKTTAMTVLARTHRYVTDETLAITPDGTVIPYAKPLLIGRHPDVKSAQSASSLGLRPVGDGVLRLAAVVLLDRREAHQTPAITDVPLVEAMIELAGESSYFSALETPLLTLANLLTSTGGARRMTYSEASTLPLALDQILADPGQVLPEIAVVSPLPLASREPRGWVRSTYTDALLVDGRLMVLREQTITVLDGIAPIIWVSASGVSIQYLTQVTLHEHPAPPDVSDPAAVVASVVEELAEAGLLREA